VREKKGDNKGETRIIGGLLCNATESCKDTRVGKRKRRKKATSETNALEESQKIALEGQWGELSRKLTSEQGGESKQWSKSFGRDFSGGGRQKKKKEATTNSAVEGSRTKKSWGGHQGEAKCPVQKKEKKKNQ